MNEQDLAGKIEEFGTRMTAIRESIGRVIYGQEEVILETLATILAGGHCLIVGVPGLGKTLLVDTLGTVLGLEDKRVQFTPDLMPPDILGSEILDENATGTRSFRFIKGPIFCQLLMADEINRASPRTQSALLQAMQERRVSIAGATNDLPRPFHVLATQNPIEQEGTYPLPEAQLDRFLMQINIGYPSLEAEREVLLKTTGIETNSASEVLNAEELIEAQNLVRQLPVGDSVVQSILDIVRSARPSEQGLPELKNQILWGPGPRASQALMLAIRAKALIEGRFSPSIEDLVDLAKPVLRHRIALTFSARADGLTVDDVIDRLCERLG
ncbi:MAG: MoxR family ATPase [Rhodospirillaceae bacterium]